MSFFSHFFDLLCPPICIFCNNVLDDTARTTYHLKSTSICPACIQNVIIPKEQLCPRCGGHVHSHMKSTNNCFHCKTLRLHFKKAIALGLYKDDLRNLVLRMKTDKTGILARSAARILLESRLSELEAVQADYVVPVPMHRSRRAERGVNSPDLLSEEIGLRLKIPTIRQLVVRSRQTYLQYTLSQRLRVSNVKEAFSLSVPHCWTRLFLRRSPVSLADKTILLVDDILTTGSTCNEITRILRLSGVRSVSVVVLARALGNVLYGTQTQ